MMVESGFRDLLVPNKRMFRLLVNYANSFTLQQRLMRALTKNRK